LSRLILQPRTVLSKVHRQAARIRRKRVSRPSPTSSSASRLPSRPSQAQPQEGAKSHVRRDLLLQIQAAVQKQWEEEKVFEAAAKEGAAAGSGPRHDRFFGNFPYPYMNGLLHLGHAFTLSKAKEGAAAGSGRRDDRFFGNFPSPIPP
ncbi:unnamed protein product, partial [Closterium sp. NIES-54]